MGRPVACCRRVLPNVYNLLLAAPLPGPSPRGKFSTVAVDKTVEKDVGNAENRCHACAAMLRLQKWHVSWRPCWSAAVAAAADGTLRSVSRRNRTLCNHLSGPRPVSGFDLSKVTCHRT